jgi:hypothetical protein
VSFPNNQRLQAQATKAGITMLISWFQTMTTFVQNHAEQRQTHEWANTGILAMKGNRIVEQ